jgi:hypothetical protein
MAYFSKFENLQDGDTHALRRVVQIGDVCHGGGSVQRVIADLYGRVVLKASPATPSSPDGQETTLTPPFSGSLDRAFGKVPAPTCTHTHTLSLSRRP